MKYLVLLLLIALLAFVLGFKRSRPPAARRAPPPEPASPSSTSAASSTPMVACTLCGVHLPRDEALPGRGGVFCSAEHRARHEGAGPA